MCGIVGILARNLSGFAATNVDTFKDMLFADELRGAHGTGMFWNTATKVKTLKAPVPASFFLRDEKVKAAMNEVFQKSKFVIGHNRHATKGGMDHDSTHPFRVHHITLIHNGTLYSHKHMADVAVDSEAIAHSIADIGTDATLKMLDGAFALVWYDANTRKLNFVRNDERPLHLIETSNCWAIASEFRMAEWIITRNKGNVIKTTSIEVGQLHQYDIDTRDITTRKVELREKTYMYDTDWNTRYYANGKMKHTYTPPPALPTPPLRETTPPFLVVKNGTSTIPKTSGLPDMDLPDPVQDLNYKLGEKIVFSPAAVVPSGSSFCLEGAVEDNSGVNHPEVRFYNSNRELLTEYLDCVLLEAEVMQIHQKEGIFRYIVKKVIPLVVNETISTPMVS